MDELLNELSREPTVHSEYGVTATGRLYAKISLHCFAAHLERRYQVIHTLNKSIEGLFRALEINFTPGEGGGESYE